MILRMTSPIPVEQPLAEYIRSLTGLTVEADVLRCGEALQEAILQIESQRAERARVGTAEAGWMSATSTALKYYGLKQKATNQRLADLRGDVVPTTSDAPKIPAELWLVTTQAKVGREVQPPYTCLTEQPPAEFFAGLDCGTGKYALLNFSKVPAGSMVKVLDGMQNVTQFTKDGWLHAVARGVLQSSTCEVVR